MENNPINLKDVKMAFCCRGENYPLDEKYMMVFVYHTAYLSGAKYWVSKFKEEIESSRKLITNHINSLNQITSLPQETDQRKKDKIEYDLATVTIALQETVNRYLSSFRCLKVLFQVAAEFFDSQIWTEFFEKSEWETLISDAAKCVNNQITFIPLLHSCYYVQNKKHIQDKTTYTILTGKDFGLQESNFKSNDKVFLKKSQIKCSKCGHN